MIINNIPQHPRLMEFFVDNPNFLKPSSMMLFLNVDDISYILSINKSFSLLYLKNGNKFVIYGNAKVLNTRYIYALTRQLNPKHIDYFSDRIIRPSLSWHFNEMKFDIENVHLDLPQLFGVLFSINDDKTFEKFENNEVALNYSAISYENYKNEYNKLIEDRNNLSKNLKSILNLAI